MQITQAIHIIISHQCKVIVIDLCVQSKSNFFAWDNFFNILLLYPLVQYI
jgi:hypothetical protein